MMRRFCFTLIAFMGAFNTCPALGDEKKEKDGDSYLEVQYEDTVVFESPSATSPIIRRLFVGEVVKVEEYARDPDGKTWIKITIGKKRSGYVPKSKLGPAGSLPERLWNPPVIVRDERPLAAGIRGLGELFGAGLNLRYLPLTRIGVTFSVGSVLDEWKMKGTAISGGLVSFIALENLSPMIEAGVSRVSYHDGPSILRVVSFYFTVGLEWMFRCGVYVNAGITYMRSMDVEIAVEWENANDGVTEPRNYGILGDIMQNDVFQAVRPSFGVGYGF